MDTIDWIISFLPMRALCVLNVLLFSALLLALLFGYGRPAGINIYREENHTDSHQ